MVSDCPKEWARWIPFAEWWYNTTFHSAAHTTPYEVVYGQAAPVHLPYLSGDSMVDTVDRSLHAREETIKLLKFHLHRAQNRMKQHADGKRSDRQFAIGDLVYIKLQPYRQQSVVHRSCLKLSARFFGPYPVLEKIGQVAYRLALPLGAKIHSVFHVSQLKKHVGHALTQAELPVFDDEGLIAKVPVCILDRRMKKQGNHAITEVLVQWSNGYPEDATWEKLHHLQQQFPEFDP